ncbi:zinc transporter ZIP11 isoform X7 [Leopardus geoffroyi]|uniref:zinc transporter ZIP11 isoform X7 n=1 Tax=Leopardus geoffroyi TaxID=46844 RepID=UPI001E25E158|nr:zinc transporter ZIP11 isoform X7 [Leopardus geoffroyi]
MADQQPAQAGQLCSPHQEGSPEMRLQALPSVAVSSMLQGHNSVLQALLGTFFTWGLTAAGAALVFIFSSGQRRILDGSLGFAAGVMLAASYWSLLAPAVEMATSSGGFGAFAFFPVAIGFTLGAAFVYLADLLMPHLVRTHGDTRTQSRSKKPDTDSSSALMWDFPASRTGAAEDPPTALALNFAPALMKKSDAEGPRLLFPESELSIRIEGLAVGVGFGAVEKTASATFESARNLAIGIGIQNFPEGLAVSLPLRGAGFSPWRAFWYGQLSGMVEPLAGVFGAFAVVLAEPLLPYALAFAAGAMVYVVMDDIIPEAQISGNGKLASWTSILGFVVMMSLDVGLG